MNKQRQQKQSDSLFTSEKVWLMSESEHALETQSVYATISESGMEIFEADATLETDLIKEDFMQQFGEEIINYETIQEMQQSDNDNGDDIATQVIKVTCRSGNKYIVRFIAEVDNSETFDHEGEEYKRIDSYFVVESKIQ